VVEASWALFVVASMAVILTPGQDTILVMSRSIAQGPGAGFTTAAGVSAGLVGHTLLATFGLGALLRASGSLFLAFKLLGAGYMLYLGFHELRSRRVPLNLASLPPRPLNRLFVDGALSNLFNPYVVLFYFAFMPQFVLPAAQHPTLTIFVLGLTYAAMAFMVKAPVALFSGWLSGWLRSRPGALLWAHRSSGALLVGLGLKLALEQR